MSGILFCGIVEGEEHPMLADYIPAKEGVRGHWDFYICNTKKNSRNHKCPSKRIGARILEQSVIGMRWIDQPIRLGAVLALDPAGVSVLGSDRGVWQLSAWNLPPPR